MTEDGNGLYRKWGRVVRYENGTTVHVSEAGEATETDGVFRSRPIGGDNGDARQHPAPDEESVQTCAAAILGSGERSYSVERLIVTSGIARHETNGVAWTEETQRLHVSLIAPPLRAIIDLASFDVAAVNAIGSLLGRAGESRSGMPRVRLAPSVSAALLPHLIGELAMEQREAAQDGKGQPVERRAVTAGRPPNWYRPSYTMRPVRAWLNLRALPFGRIDHDAPVAVALLSTTRGHLLHVLCVEGDSVFPMTLDGTAVAAVSGQEPVWHPYEGGSFGTEMML
jgi:hypothetical protein